MNWGAPHAGFVLAAYAVALGGLGLLALVCWMGARCAAARLAGQDATKDMPKDGAEDSGREP